MPNATSSVYDLINISESGDILQFIQGVNDLTGQWFMAGILLAGFIILFVSMRSPTVGNKDAFVTSGFITAVLAVLFVTLEFISVNIMTLIVLIFGVMFALIVLKKT